MVWEEGVDVDGDGQGQGQGAEAGDDGLPVMCSVHALSCQFESSTQPQTPTSLTCINCGKRVYEMEKIAPGRTVYHKTCFRCRQCNRVVSLGNFTRIEDHVYCKPHFMEIFRTKGNYDDSFVVTRGVGQEQNKSNTEESCNESSLPVPPEDDSDKASTFDLEAVRDIYEKLSRDAAAASHLVPNSRKTSDELSEMSECGGSDMASHVVSSPMPEVAYSGYACLHPDELPPPMFTKNLLERFEAQSDESIGSQYGRGQVSRTSPGGRVVSRTVSAPATPQRSKVRPTTSAVRPQEAVDATVLAVILNDDKDQITRTPADTCGELPQHGLTRTLLAQWRHWETSRGRGRGRASTRMTSSSAGLRSQSASEPMFHRQPSPSPNRSEPSCFHHRYSAQSSEHSVYDYDETMTSCAEVLTGVDNSEHLPPPLMTKYMLAKFRSMEAEAQILAGLQSKHHKDFKWEVKEVTSLSRVVSHGQHSITPKPGDVVSVTSTTTDTADCDAATQRTIVG
jgi:hypothetical protein